MKHKTRNAVLAGLILLAAVLPGNGQQRQKSITGIGVKLQNQRGLIVAELVLPGGSAEQAGLKSGEKIIAIDGQATRGKSVQEVVTLITGPEGTSVKLLVEDSKGDMRTISIQRRRFKVSSNGPSDFIGVFRLQDNSRTVIQIKKSVKNRYEVLCPSEEWEGIGILYHNANTDSHHFKGVRQMGKNAKIAPRLRGIVGFLRIDYISDGVLSMTDQWVLSANPKQVRKRVLVRASDRR